MPSMQEIGLGLNRAQPFVHNKYWQSFCMGERELLQFPSFFIKTGELHANSYWKTQQCFNVAI